MAHFQPPTIQSARAEELQGALVAPRVAHEAGDVRKCCGDHSERMARVGFLFRPHTKRRQPFRFGVGRRRDHVRGSGRAQWRGNQEKQGDVQSLRAAGVRKLCHSHLRGIRLITCPSGSSGFGSASKRALDRC